MEREGTCEGDSGTGAVEAPNVTLGRMAVQNVFRNKIPGNVFEKNASCVMVVKNQNDSSQIGSLLFGHDPRHRRRRQTKNYINLNKKIVVEKPPAAEKERLSHLKEFASVPARFTVKPSEPKFDYLKKNAPKPTPCEVFSARHPETEELPRQQRKPALPTTTVVRREREQKDFVERNKKVAPPRGKPRVVEPETKHENYGTVPAYLLQRRADLADEERRKREAQDDPNAPPGTTKMVKDSAEIFIGFFNFFILNLTLISGR